MEVELHYRGMRRVSPQMIGAAALPFGQSNRRSANSEGALECWRYNVAADNTAMHQRIKSRMSGEIAERDGNGDAYRDYE